MAKIIEVPHKQGKTITVGYEMFGDRHCVFTSLSDVSEGASINYSEAIVISIAKTEGKAPLDLRYYDLQTQHSYGMDGEMPKPGDFQFEEVVLEATSNEFGIRVKYWQLTRCPESALRAFSKVLGQPAIQVQLGVHREPEF